MAVRSLRIREETDHGESITYVGLDVHKAVTDIAWSAQLRLSAKFRRLVARRVIKTKAVVAVARELTGFVWAIGREVQTSGWQGITTQPATSTPA
jgi:hypothetical protein